MNLPFPIVVLDFETFFDIASKYTIKKMTTEAYVRDPRFRAHGLAIRYGETGLTEWVCPDTLNYLDFSDHAVLCHHAHFDGLILAHHYGIRPRMWLDTMAMGRALFGSHISVALESLARHFNLAPKSVPYAQMDGKQWEQMDDSLRSTVASGACHDVDLTWDIFQRLAAQFPAEEFALIDQTVRMFTEPTLVGDTARLSELYLSELERKAQLLGELGVTAEQLRSNAVLIGFLEQLGVEIEYKEGKNGPIPAFAKTDQFMRDLCDDDDPRVAALAGARLAHSSAIVETRLARLCDMSTRGAMPVYLNYCGAHTKRFSGGDKINWQNNPRSADYPRYIRAADTELCVVADASQIECRQLNEFAGQTDVVEMFRRKEDIYCHRASQFYGFEVTKAHQPERGTGKQLELSCGYGAGGNTIVSTAKKGTYGPPVFLTVEQGLQARNLYRQTHPAVVNLWNEAGDVLGRLSAGHSFVWRSLLQIKNKRIYLPNGLPLIYETLRWDYTMQKNGYPVGWQLQMRTDKGVRWVKMYGAKLVENVIQGIARVHTTQAWLRCAQAGMRIVSMEHDKLVAVVRESEAEDALAYMQQEMQRPPVWMPNVPLDSEGWISKAMKK